MEKKMKRLIKFFIIMVVLTTIALMQTTKVNNNTLTDQQIEEFREGLTNMFNSYIQKEMYIKYNKTYTDEDIESAVQSYINSNNRTVTKNKTFGEAFKQALVISAVVCGIVALIFLFKGSYYNEILSNKHYVDGLKGYREGRLHLNDLEAKKNFWGRWFK